MSDLSEAFEEMLEVQTEALGERVTCVIGGKTVDFLADDAGVFEEFGSGGTTLAGSIEGKVRAADFPDGIAKFAEFEFREAKLQILNVRRVNATLHVVAGDPVEGES
jgi:hypothetical protein